MPMTWNLYDVVRLIAAIPSGRINACLSETKDVCIGDLGTIVMVLTSPDTRTTYEVECVGPDGYTRWLATLFADEIERVSSVGAT